MQRLQSTPVDQHSYVLSLVPHSPMSCWLFMPADRSELPLRCARRIRDHIEAQSKPMSYLPGNIAQPPEQWEQQEGQYISRSLTGLSRRHKMTILLSVGLVTAIEISNRISVNILLPDMQGNVAA